MFKPVRMKYLRAIVLSKDERAVLRELGRLGLVHVAKAAADDASPMPPPDNSDEIARCDALVAKAGELLKTLGESPDGPTEPFLAPLDEIEGGIAQFARQTADIDKRVADRTSRCDSVRAVVEQLSSFRNVNLPFSELGNFSFLHFAIGSVPDEKFADLKDAVGSNVVLLPLPRGGGRTALVAATSRTGRFAMAANLEDAGFKAEKIDVANGKTAAEALEGAKRELDGAIASCKEIEQARRELAASCAPAIRGYRDAALAEKSVLEAETQFSRTEKTVQLQGFVPADDVDKVAGRVQEVTDSRCVVDILDPEQVPGTPVPVMLRNNWFLRPFEMLVSGFGTPGYNELEPTLFVAITYMLMFGMMFGDLGHGLVLVAAGLAMVFTSSNRKSRDIGTLVALAGAASMVFGLIYGSFFGLHSFRKYALWADPLDNINGAMKMAIGCGILVISTGIVLNVVNKIRNGDWGAAFFGGFGVVGALFYWGVIGLLLKSAALTKTGFKSLAIALVVILPIVCWALYEPLRVAFSHRKKGTAEESVGETLFESCIGAFETILSYMANTISFIRLAAYALSHAAVLMATFLLADSAADADPVGLVRFLIIVIGNAIAIVLEGLVAAIQAVRLEYYEFFGKFFSGEGEEFKPFRTQAPQ